ncbi:hypothetical protein TNCV_2884461 [Trichonephila clavipes]|nr:hypothetical protein TNCV_2884461 [Trichonephila clavipes]
MEPLSLESKKKSSKSAVNEKELILSIGYLLKSNNQPSRNDEGVRDGFFTIIKSKSVRVAERGYGRDLMDEVG